MADIGRYAAQYALEFLQRLTQRDSIATDAQLSDRIFVRPRPLLDHRDGASDAAEGFEVPQQDDSIREIRDIDGLAHVTDHPLLGDAQESRCALPVQILQQLVQMERDELLLRHRSLISVKAVRSEERRVGNECKARC